MGSLALLFPGKLTNSQSMKALCPQARGRLRRLAGAVGSRRIHCDTRNLLSNRTRTALLDVRAPPLVVARLLILRASALMVLFLCGSREPVRSFATCCVVMRSFVLPGHMLLPLFLSASISRMFCILFLHLLALIAPLGVSVLSSE